MTRSFKLAALAFFILFPAIAQTAENWDLEKQKIFVNDVVMPIFIEIENDYPIPELREQMKRILDQNRAGKLIINMSPIRADIIDAMAGYDILPDGTKRLIFLLPKVIDVYHDIGKNRELFKDLLIETMLHEYFHIEWHESKGKIDCSVHIRHESEAWWNSCENVLKVMLREGRPQIVDRFRITWDIYSQAKGDPNNPLWQMFVRKNMVPPECH